MKDHKEIGYENEVADNIKLSNGDVGRHVNVSELERLALLSEELGEVQQIIGKILRHGYESYNPFDGHHTTNRSLLENELGDVFYAVDLIISRGDVNLHHILDHKKDKQAKVGQYLHHNSASTE